MKKLIIVCVLFGFFLSTSICGAVKSPTIDSIGQDFYQCISECVDEYGLIVMEDGSMYFVGEESMAKKAENCLMNCQEVYVNEMDKLIDSSGDVSNQDNQK